jgi:hypothetical protein
VGVPSNDLKKNTFIGAVPVLPECTLLSPVASFISSHLQHLQKCIGGLPLKIYCHFLKKEAVLSITCFTHKISKSGSVKYHKSKEQVGSVFYRVAFQEPLMKRLLFS